MNAQAPGMLAAIQAAAEAALRAEPWFAGLDVVAEDRGDLANAVEVALSRHGLSIVVATPGLRMIGRQDNRVRLRALVTVACAELTATNRSSAGTGRTALGCALAALATLDGAPNGLGPTPHIDGCHEFALDTETPLEAVPDDELLVYSARLTTDFLLTL